ncbi:SMC-Scp complex subunit ScpB [archaeon]|nr:MAG: SMC-Scp complex subunit ScpB [archaeon]
MNKKALLEAALFVSDKPLSVQSLTRITKIPETEIGKMLDEIADDTENEDRGVELIETPVGFEMRIKPEYRDNVAELAPFSDLSEGMMRTLAIVAVRQPVKQSVIVRYQGNKAYGYIASLEEKGLVKTEKSGRTKIIMTTPDFEKYFGKSSVEVKKTLEEKL